MDTHIQAHQPPPPPRFAKPKAYNIYDANADSDDDDDDDDESGRSGRRNVARL